GDGYAATLSWIFDLLGWSLLAKRKSFGTDLRGIVLLDEMEQHLHPSWQRAIIGLLAADFPGIQFIATTHAPLTAIGSTALSDECCQLVLLQQDGDGVIARSGLRPPRGRRADQVLTSYLFGLPTSGDDETKDQIERLAALSCMTARSAQKERELQDLLLALDKKLGSGESELERHIADAVREVLEKNPKTSEFPTEALTFELRRQLSQLFHD
ncbi:MAG: AAA family ATPase, partial [Planctomycetes bacterium]|nr:AAA family ATPase [Planctomycetota bacterium]